MKYAILYLISNVLNVGEVSSVKQIKNKLKSVGRRETKQLYSSSLRTQRLNDYMVANKMRLHMNIDCIGVMEYVHLSQNNDTLN